MDDETKRLKEAADRAFREYYSKYMSDIPVAEIEAAAAKWREAERQASRASS